MIGLIVAITLVILAYVLAPGGPLSPERARLEAVGREILDIYFENLGHGNAAAIATYLNRPVSDVQAALSLMQGQSVYYTYNAYGKIV